MRAKLPPFSRPEKGTRFVYVMGPLPPGIAGGGAVEINGKWVPIHVFLGGTIDKRRLARDIRRHHRHTTADGKVNE